MLAGHDGYPCSSKKNLKRHVWQQLICRCFPITILHNHYEITLLPNIPTMDHAWIMRFWAIPLVIPCFYEFFSFRLATPGWNLMAQHRLKTCCGQLANQISCILVLNGTRRPMGWKRFLVMLSEASCVLSPCSKFLIAVHDVYIEYFQQGKTSHLWPGLSRQRKGKIAKIRWSSLAQLT